ncbi:MAG: DUF302 domain-containing protein [Ideonella sp.]|nr:DUF302 domain-containing protein [Ideonella sp.]MCC7459508.1 DUF302 domain-containing protein [Nitrospira sp.]
MNFGFHVTIEGSFDAAVQRVSEALKAEGFGILSDIDIRKAMKEKLDKDVPSHRILGACNPPLAYRALQSEPDIDLLLPCNVTVRQAEDGSIVVGFLDPDMMAQLTGNPAVHEVARDAAARLRRVRDALGA